MKVEVLKDVLDCRSNSSHVMDAMLYGFVKSARSRVIGLLAHCGDKKLSAKLLSLFNSLPEAFRSRVLASSELGDWISSNILRTPDELRANGNAAYEKLYDMLLREALIRNLLEERTSDSSVFNGLDERIWSPLGDWMARKSGDAWRAEPAPKIGDVVAVDFDSPLASRHEARSGVLSERKLELSADERTVVLTKLDDALNNIDSLIPEYGTLIRNFTRRIIIRKSVEKEAPGNEDQVAGSSEHVPMQPGAIRILNPHLESYTVTLCMESLLHESIHNFLGAWEDVNGSFAASRDEYRAVSPWSLRLIPNSAFIHATFIYYACHRLFASTMDRTEGFHQKDFEAVQRRLSTFAAGFLVRGNLSGMPVQAAPLDKSLVAALDDIQTAMREFYDFQIRGSEMESKPMLEAVPG